MPLVFFLSLPPTDAAAGGSHDWMKAKAGIKYSYTVELRDKIKRFFVLDGSNIIPCGEETLEALKVIANFVKNTYSIQWAEVTVVLATRRNICSVTTITVKEEDKRREKLTRYFSEWNTTESEHYEWSIIGL